MKKRVQIMFFMLMFSGFNIFSQVTSDSTVVNTSTSSNTDWLSTLLMILLSLVIGGLMIFMVFHMAYVIYKGKRYKEVFTVDYFRNKRLEKGLPDTISEEEQIQQYELLDQAFKCWSVVSAPGEEELRKPTSIKQIRQSTALIDQAIELCPLDEQLIAFLNEEVEVINSAETRQFYGSKTIITAALLIAAFFNYTMVGWDGFWHFLWDYITNMYTLWGGAIVYILASRKPQFMIDNKIMSGKGKSHSFLFGLLAGLVGSAATIRTTTKWSDGTKTVDDDHSQHFIAWFISLIILVVVASLVWIWALFNYLRNYVIYK